MCNGLGDVFSQAPKAAALTFTLAQHRIGNPASGYASFDYFQGLCLRRRGTAFELHQRIEGIARLDGWLNRMLGGDFFQSEVREKLEG